MCIPGCVWGRRLPAARGCRSSRRPGRHHRCVGAAARPPGVDRGIGRARTTGTGVLRRRKGCYGCTEGSKRSWGPRDERCEGPARSRCGAIAIRGRRRGDARAGAPADDRLGRPGGRRASSWPRCRWRCCAPGPRWPSYPRRSSASGSATLGELAALPVAALADRFGRAGLLAYELACGGDGVLRPRPASEMVRESLELPEAGIGPSARARAGPADRSRCSRVASGAGGRSGQSRCRRCWSSRAGPGASRLTFREALV